MHLQPFQPGLRPVEKLIDKTNRERFFPNRTRRKPREPTNQPDTQLISIEHGLNVAIKTKFQPVTVITISTNQCKCACLPGYIFPLFVTKTKNEHSDWSIIANDLRISTRVCRIYRGALLQKKSDGLHAISTEEQHESMRERH